MQGQIKNSTKESNWSAKQLNGSFGEKSDVMCRPGDVERMQAGRQDRRNTKKTERKGRRWEGSMKIYRNRPGEDLIIMEIRGNGQNHVE